VRHAIPTLALLSLFASAPALADIPPPPYTGVSHATVGGLKFERGEASYPAGRPGRRSYPAVRLTGCAGRSRNCNAVTRAGVIGWAIVSVNGAYVSYGALTPLTDAFGGWFGRDKVRLVFERGDGGPPRPVTLSLDRR
jgi:hypothetical protein